MDPPQRATNPPGIQPELQSRTTKTLTYRLSRRLILDVLLRRRNVITKRVRAAILLFATLALAAQEPLIRSVADLKRELRADESPLLTDAVFKSERRLRPVLRALLKDPQFTGAARYLLAVIAEPKDIERILTLSPPPPDGDDFQYWRYAVATALIQPTTESGWQFLERSARGDYNDGSSADGAIQSLQLNGTARSQSILRSLRITPGQSPSLTDRNLETAAMNIAMALGPKTWRSNDAPRFNETADKALIDMNFAKSPDRLVYTATFHKVKGFWTLRNVHETLQVLVLPAPPLPKP